MTTFALLRASHLPPTIAVTAIATSLAVAAGRGSGAIAVASAVGAGQLTVGWSNDYIDRDRDRVAGRDDKPIVAEQVRERTVGIAAIVAGGACAPLSLLSGWRAGVLHLVAVLAAVAYNMGLKARIVSPIPYVVAFGILPAFVTLGLPGHPLPPLWAVGAAAALGCGAHFINTLGDTSGDLASGVLGMPQRLGPARSLGIGASLLAIAVTVLTFAPPGGPRAPALVLFVVAIALVVGVVLTARSASTRIAWPLTIATAVVAVVLLIANGDSLT